jgi:hypothetical protein
MRAASLVIALVLGCTKREATSDRPLRIALTGFSLELPAGWHVEKDPRPEVVFGASKHDATSSSVQFLIVMRLPTGSPPSNTEAGCAAIAKTFADSVTATDPASALVDLPVTATCAFSMLRDTKLTKQLVFAAPEGNPFYVACEAPMGDRDAVAECTQAFASWRFER